MAHAMRFLVRSQGHIYIYIYCVRDNGICAFGFHGLFVGKYRTTHQAVEWDDQADAAVIVHDGISAGLMTLDEFIHFWGETTTLWFRR